MWRRIAKWHRKLEDDCLALMRQPALAETAPPGYRRQTGQSLATLSPLERQQLHAFALAFRGARGYRMLGWLALAFSLAGALLHLALPGSGWVATILSANAIGFVLAFAICGAWFNYRRLAERKWQILRKMAGLALLATAVFWGISVWFLDTAPVEVLGKLPRMLAMNVCVALMVAVPMIVVGVLRKRQHEVLNAQLQRDAERERLARELSESQLRLLRAQIEPHFLFNTLGAVQQLADHGAPRAAALTANLIDFLRASLGDMRSDQVALKAEFGLVESYLKIMLVRLGEGRLGFRLELPPALEQVQVPSMILLTLAENAIKHGIEPALRGGEIVVSAALEQGALRLRVQDSGAGMSATPGKGLGLDNLRHRLRLTYGAAAVLTLQDADPGLVADIVLPAPEAGR
jgi:signal transduction histidine kinase